MQTLPDFQVFYRHFLNDGSLQQAIYALNATAPSRLYYRTTAQKFFYDVWASYKTHQCTEEQIELRARRLYRRAKKERLPRTPSIGHFKRQIMKDEAALFERYRSTYFMYDLNATNQTRFPVTYEEAEAYRKARTEL